jgi:hypothetical protein
MPSDDPFVCARCFLPATDQFQSVWQPGRLLTMHLAVSPLELRLAELCRAQGGPTRPNQGTETLWRT